MKLTRFLLPALWLAGATSGLFTVFAASGLISQQADQQSLSLQSQYPSEQKEFFALDDQMRQGLPLSEASKERYEALAPQFLDLRDHEPSLDNHGGPDGFGYGFVDNQGGDTATYSWIELRGDPNATWLTFASHDDAVNTIPIGFTFPFYGSNFDTVTVSTNGNLQFASRGTTFSNVCLPTTIFNGPTMFVFWDDLHQDYGGIPGGANTIGYRTFDDYMVVEWDSVGHCCSAGSSYKFEVIFWADGRIKYQYSDIVFGTNANSQTIGIQQSGTGTSLQYDCNAVGPQPLNQLAIWFAPAESGTLTGTVRNDSGELVAGARVIVEGSSLAATTDNAGEFSFPVIGVGTYSVTASRTGHSTETIEGVEIIVDQTTTIEITLEDLGLLTFTSADVPVAIPEVGIATSILVITESATIVDLDILINITHTYDSDMAISLLSPQGTTVMLCENRGPGGDNFTNTVFDDEAEQNIAQGTPPFTGSFHPEGNLSDFDAENIEGTWTLTVNDDVFGDEGTLDGWEIYVTPTDVGGGTLTGTIRTSSVNLPIIGANVSIPELGEQANTNANGVYTMTHVPAGTYSVLIQHDDHCDSSVANVSILEEQSTTLDVSLHYATASFSATSISQTVVSNGTAQSTFTISNDEGNCALQFSIADTSAWLSESPDDGQVSPGSDFTITVNFNAAGLIPGTFNSLITVTHNASAGQYDIPVTLDVILAGDEPNAELPTAFALKGNFPNPFNATTELQFAVPSASHVSIKLFNIVGQEIRTLLDQTMDAGQHVATWDGTDSRGINSPTGIYLVQMTANDLTFTGKLMLLK